MKYSSENILLLLTGCINPGGMIFTSIQDPDLRRLQYVEAINFYLRFTSLKILFVENSGEDISNFFLLAIAEKRLEVLSFKGNDYDKQLGKGYGELLILKYAFQNSLFLNNAHFFFKVTGRHKILNIKTFTDQFNHSPGVDVMADLLGKLTYADSKFFGATTRFLRYFLSEAYDINDSKNITFEVALGRTIHRAVANGFSFSFFSSFPRCSGFSGTTSLKYDSSWLYWFRHSIKYKMIYKFLGF